MKKIICLLVILVPFFYATLFYLPNAVSAQSCTAITYPGCTGGNACYDFAIYQRVEDGDTNCIVADLLCQINPVCTKITGDQCCPLVGYDYCQGMQSAGGCAPPNYVGARCCSNPTPTPTPAPTSTPTPTPTPTPPAGCQNNADCGTCKQCCIGSPNYCTAYGYFCSGARIPGCWASPSPSPSPTPPPGVCTPGEYRTVCTTSRCP